MIICCAALLLGYIFYGRYLCKKWGVGENDQSTPAHTMEDGVDYVPAKAPILMGHHFSSIAGAGPITGPISAAAYAFSWNAAHPDSPLKGATAIFGGGIAGMIDPSRGAVYDVLYTLLVLTYSTFCLTSLDTCARLARFMFQEFWLDGSKGETPENVTGCKKVLANPYVATAITVSLGILLGMNGYEKIWSLFGSANQLLAALGLLAVAAWLGKIGKDNKMFLLPMAFMLCVSISSLYVNTRTQLGNIAKGGADWGPYAQVILSILLILLAVVLAIEGCVTIYHQFRKTKTRA